MTTARAMDDEAKGARRLAILEVASHLLDETPYAGLTMSQVAQAAGLAKGTLYLYFKTKEEIYLELLVGEFVAWMTAISEGCPGDEAGIAAHISRTLCAQPRLIRLLALQHAQLEAAVDAGAVMMFRRRLRDAMLPCAEALEAALGKLGPGDGFRLLIWTHAAAIGLIPLGAPSATTARAHRAMDLAMFRLELEPELAMLIEAMLVGWPSPR
jgi:AcrR family transcriptional regulator